MGEKLTTMKAETDAAWTYFEERKADLAYCISLGLDEEGLSAYYEFADFTPDHLKDEPEQDVRLGTNGHSSVAEALVDPFFN